MQQVARQVWTAVVKAQEPRSRGFVMVNARPIGKDVAMRDWFDLFGWLLLSGALLYTSFLVLLPVVD